MLFVFLWVYWCPTQFPYQIISCRRIVTRLVSHVEQKLLTLPEYLSSSLVFSGVCVARSLVFCVMFCRSLFVLRFTASDCPSGIFNLFLYDNNKN